jgi:C-terminal processing protease CtpA/Prc
VLSSIADPGQRKLAIEAIGKVLAAKNTDAAVAWANGLADAGERQAAQGVIYDAAPRGIGAMLTVENGFPTVRGIVPDGPLDGSGVQPGDQIVELRESNGAKHTLYAKDLTTTVNLIRGEPGSQVTLRLLRQNTTSGQLEEYLVPITRQQLYLNEKTLPNDPR